eukprot:GHVU01140766.1.p2 GENE.GHVU01140766.1~~GHVU01140766.1.p2  ORF type:complete len:112 (+),score=17.86 GHVU01140766.1:357-692(+)
MDMPPRQCKVLTPCKVSRSSPVSPSEDIHISGLQQQLQQQAVMIDDRSEYGVMPGQAGRRREGHGGAGPERSCDDATDSGPSTSHKSCIQGIREGQHIEVLADPSGWNEGH